jgi:hypothetical protein
MKCTPQNAITSASVAAALHEVGDVLDLGHLIVVREDHRVPLGRERADLGLKRANPLQRKRGRRRRKLG